jgi:alanine racemase
LKISTDELKLQRPTWAEIDLDALHSNFLKIQQLAPHSQILAVVKANAYGHGAEIISRELEKQGVACLGVATAGEGIELRNAGIRAPILILGGITPDQVPLLKEHSLTTALHNRELLTAISDFCKQSGQQLSVQLKVDTGMGRLGFQPGEAAEALRSPNRQFQVEGVFTHFGSADIPEDPETKSQIRRFESWIGRYASQIQHIHAANSAAILNYPESHYAMVRPGILLYGISPVQEEYGFHPILELKSRIIALREVKKGETIGYGRTFRASRDSLIATLPIGYNDGLRRSLSNRLHAEVCGNMCLIAGTISMDLCMVDVTDVANKVRLYDIVTLLGPKNSASHWAELLETIPYEITCLIGSRVPRIYYKNRQISDIYLQ